MTAKLIRHRALGARILIEFVEATPETTPETAAGAGASLEGRVSRHDSAKADSRPEATGVRPIHEEAAAKAAQAVGSAGNGEMSRKPAAG